MHHYFVVRVPEQLNDNNSDNQQEIEAETAETTLSQEDLNDAAAIKHEWAEARKKHQHKLKVADEKIVKTDQTD